MKVRSVLLGATLLGGLGVAACLPFEPNGTYACGDNAVCVADGDAGHGGSLDSGTPGGTGDGGKTDAGEGDAGSDGGQSIPECAQEWCPEVPGVSGSLYFISGNAVSADEAWVVGINGLAAHWKNRTWEVVPPHTSASISDVWGADSNTVFGVTSDSASILDLTSPSWARFSTSTGDAGFHAILGYSRNEVWALDERAGVYFSDGGQFTKVTVPTSVLPTTGASRFQGVALAIAPTHDVYVAGANAYVGHRYPDAGWVQEPLPGSDAQVYSIFAAADGTVWLGEVNGVYKRNLDGGWHYVLDDAAKLGYVADIWGSGDDLYAVTDVALLHHPLSSSSDKEWTVALQPPAEDVYGFNTVFGNATDVWATGDFTYDGGIVIYHHHR